MESIEKCIRERRSVRSFQERELSLEDRNQLALFCENVNNPYHVPVEFQFLEKMSCPVVVGTDLYLGSKVKNVPYFNEALGYSFEKLVLYAQFLGVGTVWIGGTMDRNAFEKAMNLKEDEIMPCVSPLGYPSKKMSLREMMMRKGVKADNRKSLEEIVFVNSFDEPFNLTASNQLYLPLEMVRLAPSAVNHQPWRILVKDDYVHFYLKRSKNFHGGKIDMQKIDMGIALCHFELMAHEAGLKTSFTLSEPDILVKDGLEYIASYRLD